MTAYFESPDVIAFGPHRRVKTRSYDTSYKEWEPYWDEYLDYLLRRDIALAEHCYYEQHFFVMLDDDTLKTCFPLLHKWRVVEAIGDVVTYECEICTKTKVRVLP